MNEIINQQQNYQSKAINNLKCSQNNKAQYICSSKSCRFLAFICSVEQCKCNQNHFQCKYSRLKFFMQRLQIQSHNRKQQHSKALGAVIKMYEEAIDAFSKDLFEIMDKIDNYQQLDEAPKSQAKLIKCINEGNNKEINGTLISKVQEQFVKVPQQCLLEYCNAAQMKAKWQINKENINKVRQSLKEMTLKHQIKKKTLNSQITKEETMIKQFLQAPSATFKLLYRASENKYEAKKFHQKCDGIPNTLVIAQTQFGKVIGGYTPLTWNEVRGNRKSDHTSKSFLFSVTNNEKYPMIDTQKTIYCGLNLGPVFGDGSDLCINDKSNTSMSSYASFPTTYNNGRYIKNQSSYEAFSGAKKGYYFAINQWQVYSVQFN